MSPEEPRRVTESQQEQIDALSTHVDALETRVDMATTRAANYEYLAYAESRRTDELEGRVDIHDALIAALEADGSLKRDQVADFEHALRTARVISAAVGIVMAKSNVGDVEAFAVLSRASQNTNRKLRVIAEEVVNTREISALTRAAGSKVDAV